MTMIQLLGPLVVLHEGRSIPLGGVKQRATLGLLALRANQVVPTSHLLEALWPGGDPPASARKILQNAVWSLRSALSVLERPGGLRLATQRPGYALYVEPAEVDLLRFREQVDLGRAQLAAATARPETASRTLRAALDIWRGEALADLVESGIAWPELLSAENARLDAFEDYIDAELACGRHQSVLAELSTVVETDLRRERSCGQLMLALYRCGRHPDALAVYSRTRSSLVEGLGLEPGPALQSLQQAILNHEPSLTPSGSNPAVPDVINVVSPPEPAGMPPDRQGTAVGGTSRAEGTAMQRHPLSVVLFRVRLGSGFDDRDQAGADAAQAAVTQQVRVCVEQLGGAVVASIGSATLAAFTGHGGPHDDASGAVRAALSLRASLSAADGDLPRRRLVSRIAVVSGEALMQLPATAGEGSPVVDGSLVDECEHLLATVPDDDILVCERTRNLTTGSFAYSLFPSTGGWQLVRPIGEDTSTGHTSELAVVRGLLDRTLVRQTSHLLTIVSEMDGAMSSFLAELQQTVSGDVLVLAGRATADWPLDAATAVTLAGVS